MDKVENKKGLKLINQISFYLKKLAQVYIKIKGNKAKREKLIKIINEQAEDDFMRSRRNQ